MLEQIELFFRDIWLDIAIALAIFLLFWLANNIFTRYIFKIVLKITKKSIHNLDTNILLSFAKPLKTFFTFTGLYLALRHLPLSPAQDILVSQLYRSSIIILIAWGLYNLTGYYSFIFQDLGKKIDLDLDNILVPFLSKIVRFIIIALAISIIANEWGYDMGGFVAGLGLGGLAIALAAQDAIANMFGGVVIILDKPFTIGDWILTPSVEGTVEEVTFRSTRVRTFAKSLVTVPNAKLANEPITNWTRMGKRRISFHLGVTYTTPRAKLKTCVNRIEEMLNNHPEVHKETIFVKFDAFNDSSLDIFIYFFTVTTKWGEFLEVKQDINFKIMEILEEEGVSVAFPSRSLYFENNLQLDNPQKNPIEKPHHEENVNNEN